MVALKYSAVCPASAGMPLEPGLPSPFAPWQVLHAGIRRSASPSVTSLGVSPGPEAAGAGREKVR